MWILFLALILNKCSDDEDNESCSSLDDQDVSIFSDSSEESTGLFSELPESDFEVNASQLSNDEDSSFIPSCDLNYLNYNTSIVFGETNFSINGHFNDLSCSSNLIDTLSSFSFIYLNLIFEEPYSNLNLNFTIVNVSFSFSISSLTQFQFQFFPPSHPYHFTFSNYFINFFPLTAQRFHILHDSKFSSDSASLKAENEVSSLPFKSADIVYFDISTFYDNYDKLPQTVNYTGFETPLNISYVYFNDDGLLLVSDSNETFNFPYEVKSKLPDLALLISIHQNINFVLNTSSNISNLILTSETNADFEMVFEKFENFENSSVSIWIKLEIKEGIHATYRNLPSNVEIIPSVLYQPSIPEPENPEEESDTPVALIVSLVVVFVVIVIVVIVIIYLKKRSNGGPKSDDSSDLFNHVTNKQETFELDIEAATNIESDDMFV